MKYTLIALGLIAALAACSGSKEEGETVNTNDDEFAYYCQDSVAEHFTYFKEQSELLEAQGKEYQETMMKLQSQGEMLMSNLQRQQQAGLLSANDVAAKERQIANIQKQMQVLQETDGMAIEKTTMDSQEEFIKKMEKYGKEYSKKHGYKMLFAWQSGGQILYIDEALDVTEDFIAFMNKGEKSAKSDSKKEDSEEEKEK